MSAAELIFDGKHCTGESPVWVFEEETVHWVDIPVRQNWRWGGSRQKTRYWALPEMVGASLTLAITNGSRKWKRACFR